MPRVIAEGKAPGRRPQYGLPFQQLPVGGTTPESVIEEQIQAGRQQIQNKYALQWKEVNRSKRFIGAGKSQRMLRDIDAKAKQEMLQFNQQAQQQMNQLQNIDRLAQQGMISNADEIKARIVYGPDVAKSMFPQKREEDIPQAFGKLDVYSHRISQGLENFQMVDKWDKKILGRKTWIGYPLPKEKKRKELQIWDPETPAKTDKETGKLVHWRKATPGEIGVYQTYLQEEKNIAKRKRELLGTPDVRGRIVQPGTTGGTFSDKIAESVRPQQQRTAAKPKVIRQRNTRTGEERISYDNGVTWQTSG